MNQSTKIIIAAVLLVAAMGYLGVNLLSAVSGKPVPAAAGPSPIKAEDAPRVATLITDPFFHPAVQQVLPAGSPPDPLKGALQPMPSQTEPLRPIVQGPLMAYPSPPQQPSPLAGQLPSRPAEAAPPAAQPEPPIKIALQGLVVGERPSAFLRINDAPSQKVMAGTTLKDGITILEISDKHMTVSRNGKTMKLIPGQSENL